MRKIPLALAMLGALPLAAAADVSKEDIRKLAAAGISDNVILAYIRTHGPVQRLTADDLVELKQAGASDRVLEAAAGGPPAPVETRTEVAERRVYVPSSTYVVPTSTVYYSTGWYDPYWSCWPSYYYYPRTCWTYPRTVYYPRYYARPSIGIRFGRTYSPRSYSSLRVGSRISW